MITFTTHYRILFAFVLAILLGTGCSDQGTATPPEPESTDAAAVEQRAPEPVEAPVVTSPVTAAPEPVIEVQTADVQEAQEAPVSAEDNSSSSQAASADGQKIYKASCQACHANGVAGSPNLGDKAEWAPRIAKGNDELFSSVKNGLKAMPPKGACMTCSDDDLRAAMEYMIQQGS